MFVADGPIPNFGISPSGIVSFYELKLSAGVIID
jgi:hypothetical protein